MTFMRNPQKCPTEVKESEGENERNNQRHGDAEKL